MGLLVYEILSLPALENATVLAGNLGLYNAVESIGTIDIFEYLEHSLAYYKKNTCLSVPSRVGPVDKCKNSAETRSGPDRIENLKIEKDGFYHPLKV